MSSDTDHRRDDDTQHSSKTEPGVRRFVPAPIRRSLALKLAIALLLMGAAVGAAGGVGTMQTREAFRQDVNQEYASIAEREAGDVERWNRRHLNFVDIVGLSVNNELSLSKTVRNDTGPVVQEKFTREYEPQLAQFTSDSRHSAHLYYVNASSQRIAASTRLQAVNRSSKTLHETVERSMTGDEAHMTAPYEVPDTNQSVPRVAYVTQLPDVPWQSTDSNGYVVLTMPLDAYSSELVGGANISTTVVGPDDRKLMTENGANLLTPYGQDEGIPERARQLGPNASGATTVGPARGLLGSEESRSLEGKEYVVGYSQVPGTDWAVLVHVAAEAVYGPVVSAANRGFAATLLGVVVIVVAGAVVGRSLTSSIDDLTRKTRTMQEGDLDVELASARVDAVGELYAGMADMRDSLKHHIDEAERARKEAEVSRAEAMATNEYLEEKAETFGRVMESTAAGDVTQRMKTDGENDSMDRIATGFNEMVEELEKTTGQLKSFADEVAESGDVVLTSARSVREASEQVAESIQKISDDAYEQKGQLEQVSDDLDELVGVLESIRDQHPAVEMDAKPAKLREIATTLQQIADRSERTISASEHVAGAAEEQAAELNEVSSRAERLKRYAGPLSDILNRFETEAEREFVFAGGPSQQAVEEDGD